MFFHFLFQLNNSTIIINYLRVLGTVGTTSISERSPVQGDWPAKLTVTSRPFGLIPAKKMFESHSALSDNSVYDSTPYDKIHVL